MLKGECSPQEIEQVMKWLREDPAAFEAAMLREAGEMQQAPIPPAIRQQMLDWFAAKGIPAPHETPVVEIKAVADSKWKWVGWAAAVLVVAMATWLLLPSKRKEAALAWKELRNTNRNVKKVILPDSTIIWLNNTAVLRYREDFNTQPLREVQLSGEAYFRVAHNEERPFTVQTGNLVTRVLGTEFNVEAYPEEQYIKVALEKGKVQISTIENDQNFTEQQKTLAPGEMATYDKASTELTVKSSVARTPNAWTRGGLVLNDVPLGDALKRIARKYNKAIVYDTALVGKYRHITAYYRNIEIDQVLTQLGFTCNFKFRKTDSSYHVILK